MNDHDDDEGRRECVRSAYKLIETLVGVARSHMQPGGRADIVNLSLKTIEQSAHRAQEFQWPDLEARELVAAKRDKSLQRLLKKVHRKAPI